MCGCHSPPLKSKRTSQRPPPAAAASPSSHQPAARRSPHGSRRKSAPGRRQARARARAARRWDVGRRQGARLERRPVEARKPGVALDAVGATGLRAEAQRGAAHQQAAHQVGQLLGGAAAGRRRRLSGFVRTEGKADEHWRLGAGRGRQARERSSKSSHRREVRRHREVRGDDLAVHLHAVVAVKGAGPRHQLEHQHAHGPPVGGLWGGRAGGVTVGGRRRRA
jgi:hypothetical protein